MNNVELHEALGRELKRLGLKPEQNPYMIAGTLDGAVEFVAKLKGLAPGMTKDAAMDSANQRNPTRPRISSAQAGL